MGARAQLGWMIRGATSTRATLDSLSVDLRELQTKVAGLEDVLHELRREHVRMAERQLDEFDAVRASVADATDDLMARVAAVDARTQARS
jgi:CelD/BcsL family acetyltransferase involved in cellulose biosynthesis